MNHFKTQQGTVSLSLPYNPITHDHPQIEVTYKPDNYNGWGMCKTFNALEVSEFTQADAELFALNADSKLRVKGQLV